MTRSTQRRFRHAGYQFKPQNVDPTDDPDYQKFAEEMAVKCRCFPLSDRPCAGLMAGGLCDQLGTDPATSPNSESDEDY